MLELYQYEGCSFCERVREALDALGLDYVVRSVPRRHAGRDRVVAVSGQTLVPVLVDPDRGKVVVESDDIVQYLNEHYG
ncbi:MAG TPA: glutathione S-transferase N-terminal domain-containing protein, partial [Candidatus Binatia bacterium]|nr:glutathione S-transferase N-terminal domain-containing protein [Candidatus Binatia bacterium]